MFHLKTVPLYLAVAAVLLLTHRAVGGVVVVQEDEGDHTDAVTVFQMTVTPAAEPVPALRHRLMLRENELKPGNAATHYLRALGENTLGGAWKQVREKFGEEVDTWYDNEVPIEKLPIEQVRSAAGAFDNVVDQFIRRGSERRDCDWGYAIEELRGTDIFSFLLPELQETRSVSRMLALRTRLAIAERRYDDAIDHMRMNYRLGCDLATGETLVSGLVGAAICGITNNSMIDLVGAPDSPNMYWALTELPRPMVDLRPAVRLEMSIAPRLVPTLKDAETAEHSPEEWARLLSQAAEEVMGALNGNNTDSNQEHIQIGLANTALSMVAYPEAKQRLIASGMDAQRVEQMPVGQVILIDCGREWQRIADQFEKWWYIPYPVARERMYEANRLLPRGGKSTNYGEVLASTLLPALQAARGAQVRMEWQIGGLRVIEALRMHAAAEGHWPQSLDEITCVPVPQNPVTETPYIYRLEGETAIVELPYSDGFRRGWRFEMKLETK